MKKKEIISEPTDIEFDGVIVKLKNGVYKCPFNCSQDSGYPIRKWKTEKGFRQHMEKCYKRPSYINKLREDENKDLETLNKMKEELLPTLPYKIGQKIFYVREIIVKPTHVKKWNRLVRVRYEEEKDFRGEEDIIKSIDINIGFVPNDLESLKHFIVLNGHIKLRSLCNTLEEAVEKAKNDEIEYKKACDFAAFCR